MRISPMKDAYGQEIWAHFNGKAAFELIERDDGYVDLSSGPGSYFTAYEEWPEYQRRAIDRAKGGCWTLAVARAGTHFTCRGRDSMSLELTFRLWQ